MESTGWRNREKRSVGRRSHARAGRWWTLVSAGIACAAISLGTGAALAQEGDAGSRGADNLLRVFLDCDRCDFDHFRREVPFVDYVRDRADAELHVLVTSQDTGGGGEAWDLFFLGLDERAGRTDTLSFVSRESDTDDEVRDGLTRTFKLGLVPHVAETPAGPLLDIRYTVPTAGSAQQTTAADDPWNLWVFRARVGAEWEGESRRSSRSFDGSLSASRTTEHLKIDLSSDGRWERDRFEFSDGTMLTSTSRSINHEGLVVWSLGPHWSAGARASALTSTHVNQDFTIRAAPAVQYSLFPYAESTRRQITVLYSLGLASFNYEEVTLFDMTEETYAEQRIEVSTQFQQPWGEIHSAFEASAFLHDPSLHRVDLSGRVEYRLARGLNLSVEGGVARVKDQLYVPREDIADEDVLLQRRQLGTDFEFDFEVGFSFTFGSVTNNVVNPRMGNGRGRRFF